MTERYDDRTQAPSEALTASSGTLGNPPAYPRLGGAHSDLLEACRELGNLMETPAWFTDSLAIEIAASGRKVEALTVGELVAMARRAGERLNATASQPEAEAIDPYGTSYC